MLEIENERFQNEQRNKDLKIDELENDASSLNEKLLILKLDFEEKQNIGQKTEGRLKEQLKDISEELIALKKKRNQMFFDNLQNQGKINNKLDQPKSSTIFCNDKNISSTRKVLENNVSICGVSNKTNNSFDKTTDNISVHEANSDHNIDLKNKIQVSNKECYLKRYFF